DLEVRGEAVARADEAVVVAADLNQVAAGARVDRDDRVVVGPAQVHGQRGVAVGGEVVPHVGRGGGEAARGRSVGGRAQRDAGGGAQADRGGAGAGVVGRRRVGDVERVRAGVGVVAREADVVGGARDTREGHAGLQAAEVVVADDLR